MRPSVKKVVDELHLDVGDPLTYLFAFASSVLDEKDALQGQIAEAVAKSKHYDELADLQRTTRLKLEKSEADNAALRQELRNIVDAKRFSRTLFDDDTSFADWAQSRCRAALLAGKEKP